MSASDSIELKDYIRSIPDFPKPGILFRDITPLLASADALRATIVQLADRVRNRDIDVVAAAEARGFIFAAPLAIEIGAGFVPVRKPGKLTVRHAHTFHYELEVRGPIRWKFTLTEWNQARTYFWWMTCWQPVVLWKRAAA